MKNPEFLTKKFEKNISVVLRCFERLVLFGTYQPIYYETRDVHKYIN